MALNKEQIDILTDNYIVSLYSGMEQEVINDIARRINKTGRYTETAEIQARNMRDLGFSTQEIQTEVMKTLHADPEYIQTIAENTRAYKKEIKEIINDTITEALINGEDMVAQAGTMAWNDDLQMWAAHGVDLKKDSTISQLQEAFIRQTNGSLKNITQTTAFVGTDFGTTGVVNAYQKAMDLTALKVATGNFSYQSAVVDVIKTLSHGLSTIDYASGRKYHIDTAVRMTARTSLSQLAGKITEHNCDQTDCELVYVDAHPGARPTHADWQGEVYVYRGHNTKYDDFYDATDYGSATGLKGINCTHNFYPYWEGDPVPKFKEPDPVEVNGKEYTYYEAAQQQRKMERAIRDNKREINALKATKDPAMAEAIENSKKALQDKLQKYNNFSNAAGIEPQRDRLRVYDSVAAAKQTTKIAASMDGRPILYNKDKPFEINIPGRSEKINKSMSEAAAKVAKLSGQTGHEHGLFVDLISGDHYNLREGDANTVPFEFEDLPKGHSFAFVHSHTKATPISTPDLDSLLTTENTDIMAAVRIDGVISYTEKTETVKDIFDAYEDISKKNSSILSKFSEDDESMETRIKIENIYREALLERYTKGEVIIRG